MKGSKAMKRLLTVIFLVILISSYLCNALAEETEVINTLSIQIEKVTLKSAKSHNTVSISVKNYCNQTIDKVWFTYRYYDKYGERVFAFMNNFENAYAEITASSEEYSFKKGLKPGKVDKSFKKNMGTSLAHLELRWQLISFS